MARPSTHSEPSATADATSGSPADQSPGRELTGPLRHVLERVSGGACLAGADGRVRYANRELCTMLRGASADVYASDLTQLLPRLCGIDSADVVRSINRVLAGAPSVEWIGEARGGAALDLAVSMSLLPDDDCGDPRASLLFVEFRNARASADADPAGWWATRDPLTGLPNRATFMDRLGLLLARGARTSSATAIMFIDLDDFKAVNDDYGHQAGDQVLTATARRLTDVMRPFDTVTRLADDQFAVICVDLPTHADAVAVATRLLDVISMPVIAGEHEVTVTSSIGIAIAHGEGASADAVLHEADAAMGRAKARGKNQIEVFDDALRTTANHRATTERLLRRALRDDLFRMHYQPIYELSTGDLMSVESLLRLEHPERGLLSPARFIDVAEQSGLIIPIGEWVLRESCRQLAEWRAERLVGETVRVAVNLSARQVARSDFLKTVTAALEAADLEPNLLSLELTESVFMDADAAHVRQFEELRSMGVMIEIDDFGTGYSSLGYLKRLPVGVVKVDQSFVAGMLTNAADHGIVSSVVGLGQALGITTIAEGVETAEQLDALWVLGCDQAQGYYLGRPSPPSAPPLAVTDWGEQAVGEASAVRA